MARRFVYLVRHGQYDSEEFVEDGLGAGLSKIGKQQAKLTAKALSKLPISNIYYSSLRRTTETVEPILATFPQVRAHRSRRLWEAIPCVPPYAAAMFAYLTPDQILQNQQHSEAAFSFHSKPTRGGDKHEILVTHGNLIRYFVCRVLCVDVNAWLTMTSYNCGITRMVVYESGQYSLISYNDVGHLPPKLHTDNFHVE